MKLPWMAAMVLLAALNLFAAELAGVWTGSFETQMGSTVLNITFESGKALAGKVQAGDYGGPIENARLDGEKISFETTIEHGKLSFEGTVAGNEMKLNMTGTQGNKYVVTCKRRK